MSMGVSSQDLMFLLLVHKKALIAHLGEFRSSKPMRHTKHIFRLDPSIRVTYHPLVKKVSHTGFYSKISNHVFSQRITVFNTKSTPINNFKVIDQMPVSENSHINVKLVSPGLSIPDYTNSGANNGGELKAPPPVKVSDGVLAQWEGADEQGFDIEALGKDGKFNWVCSVPSQGKINLLLSWEVTAPLRTDIVGL